MLPKIRLRYILKCLKVLLLEKNNNEAVFKGDNKNLLLVKTDAIGDYILFRNFIEEIKTLSLFTDFKITLVANELVKDLVNEFDLKFLENIIYINRKSFTSSLLYRKQIYTQLNKTDFQYAINPSFSRDYLIADSLIRISNAKHKIGQLGNFSNDYPFFKNISDNWYSQIIDTGSAIQFEFSRTKKFLESIAGQSMNIVQPNLPLNTKITENYVVIFPGAGEKIKQWNPINFANTVNEIHQKTGLKIIIAGSKFDTDLANEIIGNVTHKNNIENYCGKTTLVELAALISGATCLITNDSSAYHIAACMKTKTICLLIGRHYGRFAPYPFDNLKHQIFYVLPPSFNTLNFKEEEIFSINEIKSETVTQLFFDKIYTS